MACSSEEVFYCRICGIHYDVDTVGRPKQDIYGTINPGCPNCGERLRETTVFYDTVKTKDEMRLDRRQMKFGSLQLLEKPSLEELFPKPGVEIAASKQEPEPVKQYKLDVFN